MSLGLVRPMKLPALPKLPKLAVAKAPKLTAPKIRQIKINPLSNGALRVTHQMAGSKPKQFVFQSPAKMKTHLARIEDTEWLHPSKDPAPGTVRVLDLGETP